MKTFKKNYVGKGTQVKGLEIVKVTCKLDDLVKFAHDYKGIEYVTFEVAKMKTPDEFNRTHTVYVNVEEAAEAAEPEKEYKKKPAKKSKKEVVESADEIPF